ncbi:MAG: hypothetical protein IH588_09380, partial [Anaerolineales bacterium]|nr:hypothetical protein [Anaerolineales bacterium]
LTLESAALAIRNESGFAAPLASVTVGEKNVALNIDKEKGVSQNLPLSGTPLPLGPNGLETSSTLPTGTIVVLGVIGVLVLIGVFILIKQLSGSGKRSSVKK